MFVRNTAKNNIEALDQEQEEDRLRGRVRKLFQQLDGAELEFQHKEEALKQTIGLLIVLSRSTVEHDVQALLDRLGQEVRNEARPSTVKNLVAGIKERIIQETPRSSDLFAPSTSALQDKPGAAAAKTLAASAPSPRARDQKVIDVQPDPATHSAAAQEEQEQAIEEKIRLVLGAVLEHMHVEGQKGLHDRINAVKAALAEKGLVRRLTDVRLQLADLLEHYRAVHDADRARVEEVLKELIGKLTEVEKNIMTGLLESHKRTMADNAQFTEQLEGQVTKMQEAARLRDLDAIRKAVTQQTDRMRVAIQAKQEADAALSTAFEAKVHYLERQLRDANRQLSSMTERAYRDPFLDGVYNRLAFHEKLQQEILRFERYQHPVSLLLFDMDHFKQINDTYGHQAGDTVLQTLAARVRPALRAPDFFARFGGDEFAVILLNTPLPGGVIVAERLRTLACGTAFLHGAQTLQVSLSLGVATVHVGDSVETFLERADQALYLAKERGRNQVRTEEEIPPPPPSMVDKMVGFLTSRLPFRKGKGE